MLLDRVNGCPSVVCSTEGGMDIEEVAENRPEKIHNFPININEGITVDYVHKMAAILDITPD